MLTENVKAKISGCPDHVLERSLEPEQAWELQVSLLQLCTPAAVSNPAPACVSQGPLRQWLWGHQVGGGRVPRLRGRRLVEGAHHGAEQPTLPE